MSETRPDFLSPEDAEHYAAFRQLPDGRWCGVARLLYHWTLHVDIDWTGYADRYCFRHLPDALQALRDWDGTGDPGDKWHRHPASGRRRDEHGNEWIRP